MLKTLQLYGNYGIIVIAFTKSNTERKVNQMGKLIILFGKPGVGKDTRLSEFLDGKEDKFDVLSVGNMLRKERMIGSDLGKKAEFYMTTGQLVPDDIILEVVLKGLKEAINAKKPIISNGFPRNVAQAEAMLQAGIYPDLVIEFWVDDEVIYERARNRIVCEACGASYTLTSFNPPKQEGICDKCGGKLIRRSDDEESVVRNRLEVYHTQTYPSLEVMAEEDIIIAKIDNNDAVSASKNFEFLLDSL